MTFWAAVRLLMGCPAIMRVGVSLIRELADYIDEGRHEDAIEIIRARQRGQAAGRAARESSAATEARMHRGRP